MIVLLIVIVIFNNISKDTRISSISVYLDLSFSDVADSDKNKNTLRSIRKDPIY